MLTRELNNIVMAKSHKDPNEKLTLAVAYCPKWAVTTFFSPGYEHLAKVCDGILIDINNQDDESESL